MRVPNRTAPSKAASDTDLPSAFDPVLRALAPLIDAAADRFFLRVSELMAARNPRYADTKHNPIGSARAFRDAARRGEFKTFKRGRLISARWEDVEAYVESRRRPAPTRTLDVDDDRALLEARGLRFRLPNGRAGRR